jgi:muramoyltetrapeptide carboxypeptidase LdcA involved in peptidoglycan recycling
MRPEWINVPKARPGDRVAIVSPSFAAPAIAPLVHEQAMSRLRNDFGLEPVEYPTTRQLGASPQARANDLMTAFADPSIRAVLATIGGDDQLTVLPYLDAETVRANPKPFAGYSDNTNLLNWLWNLGIPSWHGGSTMVHLGPGSQVRPVSAESLRHALIDGGRHEIMPVPSLADDEIEWTEPAALTDDPPEYPTPERSWHNADQLITAPTWGGNLELLHSNLAANRWIRPVEDYAGCILLIETSEEMPSATTVFRMLRDAGERGLLRQFPAALIATAKASSRELYRDLPGRQAYRDEQQAAISAAFAAYNPHAMLVFNLDFGHTAPQYVLPYGGTITIDGPTKRIFAQY